MDFNPAGGTTNPLLFSWEELPFPQLRRGKQDTPLPQPPALTDSKDSAMSTNTQGPFASMAQTPLEEADPPSTSNKPAVLDTDMCRLISAGWSPSSSARKE